MRKQFTFYKSFWDAIKKIPAKKDRLEAFEILCEYAIYETMPDMSTIKPSAAMVFELAYPILDKAHERSKKMQAANSLSPVLDKFSRFK